MSIYRFKTILIPNLASILFQPIPSFPFRSVTLILETALQNCPPVKRWHFLFAEQNRKWRHFGLYHCIRHSEKPPSCENDADRSINGRQMLTLHVWQAKQKVTAFWTQSLCSASRENPSRKIWPVPLFVLPFGGSVFCLFTAPVIAIESQGPR